MPRAARMAQEEQETKRAGGFLALLSTAAFAFETASARRDVLTASTEIVQSALPLPDWSKTSLN
jgi:hypothetical protein